TEFDAVIVKFLSDVDLQVVSFARIVEEARVVELGVVRDVELRQGQGRELAHESGGQADLGGVASLAGGKLHFAPASRSDQNVDDQGGRRHEGVADDDLVARIHAAEIAVRA